jgi:hypothetical protein
MAYRQLQQQQGQVQARISGWQQAKSENGFCVRQLKHFMFHA